MEEPVFRFHSARGALPPRASLLEGTLALLRKDDHGRCLLAEHAARSMLDLVDALLGRAGDPTPEILDVLRLTCVLDQATDSRAAGRRLAGMLLGDPRIKAWVDGNSDLEERARAFVAELGG